MMGATQFLGDWAASFWGLVPVTLAQSLILSFVVLAVATPFRLLNFPDLTSEGAFPLGGCIAALALTAGLSAPASLAAAMAAGAVAGAATAFIHLKLRINTLLAGILVTTMLYSLNLMMMGKSNLSIFGLPSIYQWAPFADSESAAAKIFIAGIAACLVFAMLMRFLISERGVAFRAVGANDAMAEAQGVSVFASIVGGLALAGACSAFAGALMAHAQGFADVNMGIGVLINGLAALMIGEAIVGQRALARRMLAPFVGAIVYYQLVSICLTAGLPPPYLKLATGLFVVAMLAAPGLRSASAPHRRARE